MIYLYIVILILALLVLYMRFEAGFVEINRVMFTKNKNCLKILHLSDIHINHLKVPFDRVKLAIDEEKPDFIVISGDYIESRSDVEAFLDFARYIKGSSDIYLCLGNHDYIAFEGNAKELDGFIESIKGLGINFLHNNSVCYEKNSRKYNIIGIDDIREGKPDIGKALKTCCGDPWMNIAFSHNPDIVFSIPEGTVDYLFCGHLHGGQIWAPFNLEFRMLRHDKLSKSGIRKGLHKINGINLYINKGLGNVGVPLRFLSRPEITVYYMP